MVNGHKAVSCIIFQMAGSNATQTISDIEALLDDYSSKLPAGLKINIAQSANDFLFASIHEVIKTLIEAFILVFIVVYIFLQDMRSTLIPAIAIPGSIDRNVLRTETNRLQYQLADPFSHGARHCDSGRRCHSRRRGRPPSWTRATNRPVQLPSTP